MSISQELVINILNFNKELALILLGYCYADLIVIPEQDYQKVTVTPRKLTIPQILASRAEYSSPKYI